MNLTVSLACLASCTELYTESTEQKALSGQVSMYNPGQSCPGPYKLALLANQPLTSMLQELENTEVLMHIVRDRTYTSVIAYVTDLLSYHDNQLRHNLNAVKGGKELDAIDLDPYNNHVEEFTRILEESERKVEEAESHRCRLSHTIRSGWKIGTFWYNLALRSPPALHSLFYDRIQPQFAAQHLKDQEFYKVVGFYWCREASAFIRAKCSDKKNCDIQLREAFQMNN
ncbi:hypothetical protein BDDG_05463 [Blastomyces dermatitidis ATCC 18188]|uniref:Uncharacterized protein n=1 Tax=Ajellomyces dermatitidis (strain ATCC 18188 / CBS 674.68) TaxID=653446 RepID=F2TH06_AJEDA|nr:hypothetical protein BDDG_05463 [Blastomyces dermatitidis ATCC 18188]